MPATTSFTNSTSSVQPLYKAHLPFNVTVSGDEADDEQSSRGVTLIGYTQSASADALSIVGPFNQFAYRYLMGRDCALQMELQLPTGPISLQGFPVRYVMLSDDGPSDGYIMTGPDLVSFSETDVNCLIEVSIVVMSDDSRTRFIEHLSQHEPAEQSPPSPMPLSKGARPQVLAA